MDDQSAISRILGGGLESEFFLSRIKRAFATVHSPGPDGPCASCWYGPLCVQKFTLSVCNDVQSPGQSFRVWHFLDENLRSSAPPPKVSKEILGYPISERKKERKFWIKTLLSNLQSVINKNPTHKEKCNLCKNKPCGWTLTSRGGKLQNTRPSVWALPYCGSVIKLGIHHERNEGKENVSRWAMVRDSLFCPKWTLEMGFEQPLRTVIELGFHHPRKKERKKVTSPLPVLSCVLYFVVPAVNLFSVPSLVSNVFHRIFCSKQTK